MLVKSIKGGALLGAGSHNCKVLSIALSEAKASMDWKDRTPQLAVKFGNSDGSITSWYNLKGYKTDANGDYVIGSDGNREEDESKTASCMEILGKLGFAAGFDEGSEFDTNDVIGKELKVTVKEEVEGKPTVAYVGRIS